VRPNPPSRADGTDPTADASSSDGTSGDPTDTDPSTSTTDPGTTTDATETDTQGVEFRRSLGLHDHPDRLGPRVRDPRQHAGQRRHRHRHRAQRVVRHVPGLLGAELGRRGRLLRGASTCSPPFNGAETYSLLDPDQNLVEGPDAGRSTSPPCSRAPTLRRPGTTTGRGELGLSPNFDSTPGVASATGGTVGVPYISEYSDPTGSGNFDYESVEIHVPG
jgi:hypothetical protein